MPLPMTPLFPETPSVLDAGTKDSLQKWEKRGKLDGWWKEQERIAWKIVEWRDRGVIKEQSIHPPYNRAGEEDDPSGEKNSREI